MLKCCTYVVLVLVLAGNALSGAPLHAHEHHCPMAGMADCCEKAQTQSNTPEVYAARVCCSLNCQMPGAMGLTGAASSNVPPPAPHSYITPASTLPEHTPPFWTYSPPEHNQHSPPIYIRHVALLI